MEIERKFTIKELPKNLADYDSQKIVQAYLCTDPVIRIRRQDDDYFLTYKGKGLMAREEYNLPLGADAFAHLLPKADGNIISKTRYLIPIESPTFSPDYVPLTKPELTIELDVFDAPFAPLIMAEVEFPDEAMANAFQMPEWFLEDVTNDPAYHNSNMSKKTMVR